MQAINPERIKIEHNKLTKGELASILPTLDNRKVAILDDPQRYIYKTLKHLENQDSCKANPEERIKTNSTHFNKEVPNFYRKMRVTPNRKAFRQKIAEIDNSKQQRQKKSSHQLSKAKISFSSIMDVIEKQIGSHWQIISPNKESSKTILYQPYKKRGALNPREKSAPFQHQLTNNHESCFFNVQKMALLEGEKQKKSSTIIANNTIEEKASSKHSSRLKDNSLIKEISLIKQKLNIQRIVSRNDEILDSSLLTQSIKVGPWNLKENRQLPHRLSTSAKVDHIYSSQPETPTFAIEQNSNTQDLTKSQHPYQGEREEQKQMEKQETKLNRKNSNAVPRRIGRKFIIPFQTYYYRDLLWKMNFTNSLYIQIPLEYEHRLKVFVGKGNNSCMVRGLISRRPWYAFTDKIEEANFVWTQIKNLNFFKKQTSRAKESPIQPVHSCKYIPQSILTETDKKSISNYLHIHMYAEQHNDERLLSRSKIFKYKQIIKTSQIRQTKMQNHLINNYVLGNKKALFNTMTNYYQQTHQQVFDFLPLTFHIKEGMEDKKYFQFLRHYHKRNKDILKHNQDKTKVKEYNAWIVKPGENSNRGNGIKMCLNLEDIKTQLKKKERYNDGTYKTHIVQAYIERPLLYCKRKFDLRHYMMITCINGFIKGYWYKEGYVRTTSNEYSLTDNCCSIHLTNDAVQKNLPDYGKFQKGNKLSYDELANYIQKYHKKKGKGFYDTIYKKMKFIATDAIKACSGGIDPSKLSNNFQIFGLDFMIDSNLDTWLIQINTNPCLELSCPLLSSLIPKMIENALELTLDCMFPPPVRYTPKGIHYFKQLQKQNKFELVYDQRIQKLYTGSLQVLDSKLLQQQDDVFEDSGDEWQDK